MAKGKKNTGLSYEIVVQAIFQAINDQEEVTNLTSSAIKFFRARQLPTKLTCTGSSRKLESLTKPLFKQKICKVLSKKGSL